MGARFVLIGPRGFNLLKLVYWECPGPETTVVPGNLRFTIETGITFELSGEQAVCMKRHLDRLVDPEPIPLPYPPIMGDIRGQPAGPVQAVRPDSPDRGQGSGAAL